MRMLALMIMLVAIATPAFGDDVPVVAAPDRPRIGLERDGADGVLTVTVNEKPYAPYVAYLGGSYRMNDPGISPFHLQLRVNHLEVNRRGAEWRNDLSVGSIQGVRSEYYQPLDRVERHWFAATTLQASLRNDGLFVENLFIGDYRYRQLLASLELGRNVGRSLELRAGLVGGQLSTGWASGLLPIPERDDGVVGVQASLAFDTLDDHRVPGRGVAVGLRFFSPQAALGSDVDFDRL